MKTVSLFIGLFIIGLLTQYGLADSKRTPRQAYLPAEVEKVIREEIITIHEAGSDGNIQFDESNYGGGKYQIFEVHNHFGPPGHNVAAQTDYSAAGYLPPKQQVRVQHVHQDQGTNANHLDISSSSYANAVSSRGHHISQPANVPTNHHHGVQAAVASSGQAEEILRVQHIHINRGNTANVQNSGFKAPDYLPPISGNEGANNLPSTEQQSTGFQQSYNPPQYSQNQQHIESHHQHQAPHIKGGFKGSDYLPPHQVEQHVHHNEIQHQVQQPAQLSAPDYLPPHQTDTQHSHQVEQHNDHNEIQIQHQFEQQSNQFQGPDYLPPHQASSHQAQQEQQDAQFKGPDYLPPHQINQHSSPNEIQQQNQFKGPDYLPPQQTSTQYNPQQVEQSGQYKAPDYLPPQQTSTQYNPQQVQHSGQYKAPDYLPPQQGENQHQQSQQAAQFQGPDYLPPQHGQQNNYQQSPAPFQGSSYSQQPISQSPIAQQSTAYNGPDYLPPHQKTFQAFPGSELPPGYDFVKPENSEAAIEELHKLPQEDQQELAVQSNQQQVQQQSGNFHGNTENYNVQQNNLGQVSPQLFSTTSVSAAGVQASVQNYLPPARPVQAEKYSNNLHSLSSYMNNIQSDARYGVAQFSAPRQPFPEYGPPPATQQQQQLQSVALPVTPMYHDQSTRPPSYAPTMSYASNALSNSNTATVGVQQSGYQHATFNQQANHNLQQFKPQNVRQSNPNSISRPAITRSSPPVPVRQTSSSRVRTIQILNPSAVKTLKILETSDHVGVKTIKVLGPSQNQPTGEHHIVKVVSPDEHVQTVKIFNDHEDASISGRNSYLPPAARVVRQTLTKQKQRQPFTGRLTLLN